MASSSPSLKSVPSPREPSASLSRDLPGVMLVTPRPAPTIDQHLAFIESMVAQGGPTPDQDAAFSRWLTYVAEEVRALRMSDGELRALRDAFGRALSLETNQGLCLRKPHGYPGDYEIIDRIYCRHTTEDPTLRNWDRYFHTQAAPQAVRNRKAYFINLLGSLITASEAEALPVLNVASGPARDVREFLDRTDDERLTVECVDTDPDAIAYARRVCRPHLDRVAFTEANALRFTSPRTYRLVWSAGLFDYFGDKGFRFLLERLLTMLSDDGELVVGNFSKANSTRDYMEVIGDWNLYYRDEGELRALALDCGVRPEDVRIGQEPEGVNLFLHVKRGPSFIPM